MKNKLRIFLLGLLTLFQIIGVGGILILNDMSRKKVGVNHHVIIRKKEFIAAYLNVDHVDLYKVVLTVLLVVFLLYLLFQIIKRVPWWKLVSSVMVILIGILLYVELVKDSFIALPVYSYVLMVTGVILLIEIFKVVVTASIRK